MLAANVAIQSLLLCLVIARNAVVSLDSSDGLAKIVVREVVKVPLVLDSLEAPGSSVSSTEPKILEKTTILRHEEEHNSLNPTLRKKVTEDNVEDDPTTITHLRGPISLQPTSLSTKTIEFRPSEHIGGIHDYETLKSFRSLFNSVQHLKLENSESIHDNGTGRIRAPFFLSSVPFFYRGKRATPLANSSEATGSSGLWKEPRILEKTTILRRAKEHNSSNTTLLKKVTEDNVEDDPTTTTTHPPGPISSEPTLPITKTMEFRPSEHIGEIYEYETHQSSTRPFNNAQYVKLENSVNIGDNDTGRVPASFFPSSSSSFHGDDHVAPDADLPEGPGSSGSSKVPRILEKTTILRRAKEHNSLNTTLLKKVTEDNVEDDPRTTTHLPGPISLKPTPSSTKTMEFRPSVHIGEIHDYEIRKSSTSPFNNVQHVKFENSVNIDDRDTGRVRAPFFPSSSSSLHGSDRATPVAGRKKNRVKFVETDSRYGVALPAEYYVPQQVHHHQHEQTEDAVVGEDENINNENHSQLMPMSIGHDGVVTIEYPLSHYPVSEVTGGPVTLGRPAYSVLMTDQQMHLQQYAPGINNFQTIYVKPSKFHGEVVTPLPLHVQHYEYVPPVRSESIAKPDDLRHHQGSYQVPSQPTDTVAVAKPETVVILSSHRETAFTSRTRKFPYKFYHPNAGHQDTEYYYVPEEPHAYPSKIRVSPWKKIIHLIGAFLPLGLLLATLKPNIVRVDTENMTQPNIVLSKLRDLPAEHKRGRIEDEFDNVQQDTCEDKSICQLIVNGSEPNADLLQNILWNLTNKSTEQEAKKHGLHEIFAAVKQKDCSTIEC